MSVTFSVEANFTEEYYATCSCGAKRVSVDSYEDFENLCTKLKEQNLPLGGCTDEYCFATGNLYFHSVEDINEDAPYVNVSNHNFEDIADALGIPHGDGTGLMNADDLLGRILVALAVSPESAERPTYNEHNIILCGREEGYVQNKLIALQEVCELAKSLNRDVVWS